MDKLCAKVLESLDEDEYELYIDYYKEKMPVTNLSKKYNISKTALTTRSYRLKKKIKVIAIPVGFTFKYAEKYVRSDNINLLLYYEGNDNKFIIFDLTIYNNTNRNAEYNTLVLLYDVLV